MRGLEDSVINFTTARQVKVNLFEAVAMQTESSVASVLYKAVFYRPAESPEELATLAERVAPEVKSMMLSLLAPNPDFMLLAQSLESAPAVECHSCRQTKVPTISQICTQHNFCSERCLKLVQDANGTSSELCPLCTMKIQPRGRKIVIVRSNQQQKSTCGTCAVEFVYNPDNQWRLDLLGSAVYDKAKKYCSMECWRRTLERDEEIKGPESGLTCINCRKTGGYQAIPLHCSKHALCSNECVVIYYKNSNVQYHQYNEQLICYYCLQEALADIGSTSEIPEYAILSKKLADFNQLGSSAPSNPFDEEEEEKYLPGHNLQYTCKCCIVVQCPNFISPSVMNYINYRTKCIFCDRQILIRKEIREGYSISDSTPFLINCELRLHGVCSRTCFREKMRAEEWDAHMIRCPKCERSKISQESIDLAMRALNPTIECIRRTPLPHPIDHHCTATYCLPGCRHEICGSHFDSCVDANSMVVCPTCGNSRPFEEAISSQIETTMSYLSPEEKRKYANRS